MISFKQYLVENEKWPETDEEREKHFGYVDYIFTMEKKNWIKDDSKQSGYKLDVVDSKVVTVHCIFDSPYAYQAHKKHSEPIVNSAKNNKEYQKLKSQGYVSNPTKFKSEFHSGPYSKE